MNSSATSPTEQTEKEAQSKVSLVLAYKNTLMLMRNLEWCLQNGMFMGHACAAIPELILYAQRLQAEALRVIRAAEPNFEVISGQDNAETSPNEPPPAS